MDTLTWGLFAVCWYAFASVVAPEGQSEMEVYAGEDVLLDCHSPKTGITLLEWIRPDLNSDGYVFFYREMRSYENYQHPNFRGRVKLGDPLMNNGNMSVFLTNAQPDTDTGTYKCCVSVGSTGSSGTASSEIKKVIKLKVSPAKPGKTEKRIMDGGDKVGGDKVGGDKDGGNKVGGDKDGGNKVGPDKDGENKVGPDKDEGSMVVFSRRHNGVIACGSLAAVMTVFYVVIRKRPVLITKEHKKLFKRQRKNSELPDEESAAEQTVDVNRTK